MDMGVLKERLDKRLSSMNIRATDVISEEFCRIPMGLNLPKKTQRILGYGSAASMVHPASGFQVSRALTLAPAVAENIAMNFERSLDQTLAAAWNSIWPTERVRTWELYDFGKDFLTTLTPEQTRTFFSAFFQLSDHEWQGYMSANLSVSELASVMMGVFSGLNSRMRWELIRTGMSLRSFSLLRGAISR
jgi:lycopene cyclase-like protein